MLSPHLVITKSILGSSEIGWLNWWLIQTKLERDLYRDRDKSNAKVWVHYCWSCSVKTAMQAKLFRYRSRSSTVWIRLKFDAYLTIPSEAYGHLRGHKNLKVKICSGFLLQTWIPISLMLPINLSAKTFCLNGLFFTEWSERAKQITKIWRKVPSDQRAPYLVSFLEYRKFCKPHRSFVPYRWEQ